MLTLIRARGDSERELTLGELVLAGMRRPTQRGAGHYASSRNKIDRNRTHSTRCFGRASAELHGRLVYVLSTLLMPLLAVPFGIVTMRSSRVGGLVVGTALLIAYHKTLEFMAKYAAVTGPPPAVMLWTVFAIFALSTFLLFVKTIDATGATPFQIWEELVLEKVAALRKWMAEHFLKHQRT